MITAPGFISHCESRFMEMGAALRREADFPETGFSADLFAQLFGRSLWVFFPYDDYYFFHDFTGRDTGSRCELADLHEKARSHVNALYRFPRWMRYRVPNISTVAVSERGFGTDQEKYVHSLRPPWTGGERHSIFLADLANRRLISAGLEVTSVEMVAITFSRVNPHNRAHGMMVGLCAGYFGEGRQS